MSGNGYPYYLANRPESPNADLEVTDKYSGEVAARVARADGRAVDEAIGAAREAAVPMRRLKPYERKAVLAHVISRARERRDEFVDMLRAEAGKPVSQARVEFERMLDTFTVAAEESVRMVGEVLPLEISERAADHEGLWRRYPVGPCTFITPFNFPLNLVAHKVAPALAVGCPFILKPAGTTPVSALLLGELLAETDLPEGAFSILPLEVSDAEPLVTDERLKLLSFTGSQTVGWQLKHQAGRKKVSLELGGNAAAVVDEDADLDQAVRHIIPGGFGYAGQSCISTQRVLVHDAVYQKFRDKLVAAAREVKTGDTRDPETVIGPVISGSDADRLEDWFRSAEKAGGRRLCGGNRDGNIIDATIFEDVPPDQELVCDEAFGPVLALTRFSDFDEAIAMVNDSRYGLQAGIFTGDIHKAWRAWDELEVGGVLINEVPSWRVDHMPYGGLKESGQAREGVRFSMEEMSEIRLFVLNRGS